jgi:hypothetical protein
MLAGERALFYNYKNTRRQKRKLARKRIKRQNDGRAKYFCKRHYWRFNFVFLRGLNLKCAIACCFTTGLIYEKGHGNYECGC